MQAGTSARTIGLFSALLLLTGSALLLGSPSRVNAQGVACTAGCGSTESLDPNVLDVGDATEFSPVVTNVSRIGAAPFTAVAAELRCVAQDPNSNNITSGCCLRLACAADPGITEADCINDSVGGNDGLPGVFSVDTVTLLAAGLTNFTVSVDENTVCVEGTVQLAAGQMNLQLFTVDATTEQPVLSNSGNFFSAFTAPSAVITNTVITNGTCNNQTTGSCATSATGSVTPTCEVELDKTVAVASPEDENDTCDEAGTGTCRNDPGTTCDDDADCRVVETATGWDGEPANYTFQLRNDGDLALSCDFSDPKVGANQTGVVVDVGGVVPLNPAQVTCSDTAEGNNTATVTCTCPELPDSSATDEDTANLLCLTPELQATKVCEDTNGDDIADQVTVTAVNAGDADLINCTLSDQLDRGDPSLPCADPAIGPVDNIVLAGIASLPDGTMQDRSASIPAPLLEADACNKATVSCQLDDGTGSPVLDPCIEGTCMVGGGPCEVAADCGPKSVAAEAEALCGVELEVLGCRITSGGITPNTPNSPPGGDAIGEILNATFGGQVGAPCGCIGCFDDLDSVQGQWTHSRKKQVGRFHASDYSSLVCDLDDGEGPLPRPAPANKACFAGVGALANNGGKRETPVAFRVEVEDRGEPGAGKNSGAMPDVYRIRIWIPEGVEEPEDFLDGICCLNEEPVGVGNPDIDDGGQLIHGNIQIHPVLPNTVRGICPPPEEVEMCFEEASNG